MAVLPTAPRHFGDFETCWGASRVAAQGGNPYDPDAIAGALGRPSALAFPYPPIALLLFLPLALLPTGAAGLAWLLLGAGCFVGLLLVWLRWFLPRAPGPLVAAALALGFNAAAVWDLHAGNVAALEQLLLWSALAAYASERRRLFAALVVGASLFKLWPAAFLLLLLAPSRRSPARPWTAAAALAALAALVWLPAALGPDWARLYLHLPLPRRAWGVANPSALGLFDMLLGNPRTPLFNPVSRQILLWIAYALAVSAQSLHLLWRLGRARDPVAWCLAAAALHTLLSPWPMAWGYVEAIPPALVLGGALLGRRGGGGYAAAGLVCAQAVLLCAQAAIAGGLRLRQLTPWVASAPFLLLFFVWMAAVVADAAGAGERLFQAEPAPRAGPAPAPRTA